MRAGSLPARCIAARIAARSTAAGTPETWGRAASAPLHTLRFGLARILDGVEQLVTGAAREQHVLYRRPFGTEWERLDLDTAMGMVADRVLDARRRGWQDADPQGLALRRTTGVASLGGATLDNE